MQPCPLAMRKLLMAAGVVLGSCPARRKSLIISKCLRAAEVVFGVYLVPRTFVLGRKTSAVESGER